MGTNIIFVFLVVTGIGLIQTVFAVCPPPVYKGIKGFGPGCRYRCNCNGNDQCNAITGECPNGCLLGWMGPACQYRNHAITSVVNVKQNWETNTPGEYARKAIDGDVTTCSKTGQHQQPAGSPKQRWWKAEFSSALYIVGLVIKITEQEIDMFKGFSVEIGNTTESNNICYKRASNVSGETTMRINCMVPIVGKTVQIKLAENIEEQLVLCEVEIFGGRLVSFNKPTSADSVLEYYAFWNTSYAVDGRQMSPYANQNVEEVRTCWASRSTSVVTVKWWNVSLECDFDIQAIDFFGRLDDDGVYAYQYRSYKIKVDSRTVFTDDGLGKAQAYNPKSAYFTAPVSGDAVRVERNNIILVICELEVFGECPLGKCGWECNTTCMCRSQTTGQPKIQGLCPHGCSGRWSGQNGRCDNECPGTKWGPTCSNPCGKCMNNDSCSAFEGTCPNSCMPGWIPPLCVKECSDGFFGDDCNSTCGNCKNNLACNKANGLCAECDPGYKMPLCSDACDPGQYGDKCSQNCGNCRSSKICNHVTGNCPDGCDAGYKDPNCKSSCNQGWYGLGCSEKCGSCKNGEDCITTTGRCENGCSPGWLTSMCNTSCDKGYYGDECNQTCGNCSDSANCLHVDGSCSGGCAAGYYGALCKSVTDPESRKGPATEIIVGVVIGVLLIGLVSFVGIFVYKRRLNRSGETKPAENGLTTFSNENPTVTHGSVQNNVPVSKRVQDPVYSNAASEDIPEGNSIKISDLKDHSIGAKKDPKFLYSEFKELPYGLTNDASEAKATEYRPKNRYKDLYPYNMNRVILPDMPGVSDSTYINASYINGYDTARKYIAAQGALETTVEDIWRMVWSEKISVIVMLTKCIELGKLKCVQYWPDKGSHVYADICTDVVTVEEYTDFKIRTFRCTKKESDESRRVLQFHYTAWPDKDVPDTALSLVQFWRTVRSHEKAKRLPWMVHCSAGVGRTGTFIALDYLHDQGKSEKAVNIKDGVYTLRQQRLNMVQTKEQYVYLHEAVAEALVPIGNVCAKETFTSIYRKLFTEEDIPKPALHDEFDNICEDTNDDPEAAEPMYQNTTDTDNPSRKLHFDAELQENISKSRDPKIIPDDLHRPRLGMAVRGRNDFINAVFVPTYRQKDRMILTQFPLKETVVDFVRMVWDFNIRTVVLLEDSVIAEGVYWAWSEVPRAIGPLKAELVSEKTEEFYTSRTIRYSLLNNDNEQQKDVEMFHFRAWPSNDKIPRSMESILRLISDIENIDKGTDSGPLVIQCLDGAKKSGLLCVLCCVLERMKTDREIAIAETVRLVRLRRKQVIDNFEQYRYCYSIVREYIDRHDVYANVM